MKEKKIFTYNDMLIILDNIKRPMKDDKPFMTFELIGEYQDKFVKLRNKNE